MPWTKEQKKEYAKKYYLKNRDRCIDTSKRWARENKERRAAYNKKYFQTKEWTVSQKIAMRLRSRISGVVSGHRKHWPLKDATGMTMDELKAHLEAKFKPGMSWDNYGEWHIDHIKPCASFNLSDPEQQLECFNFKNLQPLWALENLTKGNKV